MYEYQFRLKPKNSCGTGQFSGVAVVDSIESPGIADPVIITSENCFVTFLWSTP